MGTWCRSSARMCTKTNNHIYAELNCNVYEDFLEISKKILQIAFSIFDKPSFAAFASKLLHFRLKPAQYAAPGIFVHKISNSCSSPWKGFAELGQVKTFNRRDWRPYRALVP